MNSKESKSLKVGERVGYVDATIHETLPIDYGTVLGNTKHAVQIQWEDVKNSGCENGIGWIDHNDAGVLSKE